MFFKLNRLCCTCIIIFCFFLKNSFAETVNKIEIVGNDRVSSETILMFASVELQQNLSIQDLNDITIKLYDTNFFENIDVSLKNQKLIIKVKENPVIGNITFEGIKSKSLKSEINKLLTLKDRSSYNLIDLLEINKLLTLKDRSSYNLIDLENDKFIILSSLKNRGYYQPTLEVFTEITENNFVDILYKIELGSKAKIKKISFTGDKVFKDNKLKSLILSEEYKPWKFISGRKYLNENTINIDNRLLKNFYLNKGYYEVKINSSFAKLVDKNNFELIFNIQAGKKFYFNELKLSLPNDFNKVNYNKIDKIFSKISGKPYSINRIEKILETIDVVTTNDQFMSTKSTVEEKIVDNKIDLLFSISQIEKIFVKKINILGNNVTQESVIRNQLEVDEGDPFNEILFKKSLNNLNSLNFFKNINSNFIENEVENTKIIEISVEEKPTGEVMAGAGFGTGGTTTTFGVKENNYLGRGISLDANLDLSETSIKGKFSVSNPNFRNSDKLVYSNIQSLETDKLTDFGYKTNKTGLTLGTRFEYYDDFNLGLGASSFYEKIETDSTASTRQKRQEGDYFDNFLTLTLDYDKRNQRFQTSSGFRNYFDTNIPLISETNTWSNTFVATNYIEYFDKNIFKSSFYFKNANSITGENIKLSERLNIPSSRLRGFEYGKVGPKDGNDFIGGNFISTINLSTTIDQILENSQSTDFNLFLDIANIWGVDYDSSLDISDDIRSAIGVGLDWYSPIGPMNFSLSQALTSSSNDITETFRFNLGTTF